MAAFSAFVAFACARAAFVRASFHCHTIPVKPVSAKNNTAPESIATAGFRRDQRSVRSTVPTARALMDLPSRKHARSSASASADSYRFAGDFSRHFRQIVSRSRGMPG